MEPELSGHIFGDQWKPSCFMRTNGRTDRYDESNFVKKPKSASTETFETAKHMRKQH
jgi:hypothetical protein